MSSRLPDACLDTEASLPPADSAPGWDLEMNAGNQVPLQGLPRPFDWARQSPQQFPTFTNFPPEAAAREGDSDRVTSGQHCCVGRDIPLHPELDVLL